LLERLLRPPRDRLLTLTPERMLNDEQRQACYSQ
jgi:hypothetical protein